MVLPYGLNATIAVEFEGHTTGCLAPIRDISRGGAAVYMKFEVPAETRVRFSMEPLNFKPFMGRVAWSATVAGDAHALAEYPYRIGIEFTPEDDEGRENQLALYDYVTQVMSTEPLPPKD